MSQQQVFYRSNSVSKGNLLHNYYAVNSVDGLQTIKYPKHLAIVQEQNQTGLFDLVCYGIWNEWNRMNQTLVLLTKSISVDGIQLIK